MVELAIDGLSWILLLAGGFFYLVGAVGMNRMPDVFTRIHAVSVGDTMGAGLLVAGMVLQAGPSLVAAKLIIILAVMLFTGSVATHALAKAALQDKLHPLIATPNGELKFIEAEDAAIAVEQLATSAVETTAANTGGPKS